MANECFCSCHGYLPFLIALRITPVAQLRAALVEELGEKRVPVLVQESQKITIHSRHTLDEVLYSLLFFPFIVWLLM